MRYTVVTRAGLDALLAEGPAPSTGLIINPGIASDDELSRLRAGGLQVTVLERPVTTSSALAGTVGTVGTVGTQVQWVEVEQEPAAPDDTVPRYQPPARLRRHFALAAGLLGTAVRHLGSPRSAMLLPYIGYGNATRVWLQGRVLDEKEFAGQQASDSGWRNLAALYRRLESDQVRGASVRAVIGGREHVVQTDAGGYFSFDVALDQPPAPGWMAVPLSMLPDGASAPVRAEARVLIPSAAARYGVISDLDDTVLWTNVTNKLNMAWLLARTNFHTRRAFKGVAAFYRALHAGAGQDPHAPNPIFYVSNSPWHLFESLRQFLALNGMPQGPLLLRELTLSALLQSRRPATGNSKRARIEAILAACPGLPFVLIGDSGEQDPEIYADIVRRHPGRIQLIYIRNVNPDPARIAALDALIGEVSLGGTQLVVAADSEAAASHAAAAGLIDVASLAGIRAGGAGLAAQPGGSR